MHIVIDGNYISLDNIISVSNILDGDCFYIQYHSGKEISFVLTTSEMHSTIYFQYGCLYFLDKEVFLGTRKKIIKILTDAAESN